MSNPLDQVVAGDGAPPAVLLPYQQAWVADDAQLKIAEKSRRIGLTWAESSDNVLIAAGDGGSNVFYISATQDMAREYIETCAMWARAFDYAASEIAEGIYEDGVDGGDGAKRFIKTYEVNFPKTGRRIVALSSRPTNLRGKQGVIVVDEAAFAPELSGLLKAAMAMLLWGDKVRIISTHDGMENAFNQLIQEVRAGKRGRASVHRFDFRRAVADGLYRRVCLRRGLTWTQQAEDQWVAQARAFYGDDAAEELDVIPSQGGGRYLSLALIEQRMTSASAPEGPALVRGSWKDEFAWLPEDVRRYAIDGWLREHIDPVLLGLNKTHRHAAGVDFARVRNLSSITITDQDQSITRRVRIQLELFNCPFTAQQQIVFYILDRLPRFRGGAMDAGGNGSALAEAAAQRYGTQMIERVLFSNTFYLDNMPKLKAALEDATLTDIPRDAQLRDDLRAIVMVDGIPKIKRGDSAQSAAAKAAAAEGGAKLQRHGDFAVSLLLSIYAWFREAGEIDWTSAPSRARHHEATDDLGGGFMNQAPDDDLELADFGGKGAF